MTKADFIAAIAKEVKISKATVEKVLKAYEGAVTKLLKNTLNFNCLGSCVFKLAKHNIL